MKYQQFEHEPLKTILFAILIGVTIISVFDHPVSAGKEQCKSILAQPK
jgi:hypothetical protein